MATKIQRKQAEVVGVLLMTQISCDTCEGTGVVKNSLLEAAASRMPEASEPVLRSLEAVYGPPFVPCEAEGCKLGLVETQIPLEPVFLHLGIPVETLRRLVIVHNAQRGGPAGDATGAAETGKSRLPPPFGDIG